MLKNKTPAEIGAELVAYSLSVRRPGLTVEALRPQIEQAAKRLSQGKIARILTDNGFPVSQATVSRHLLKWAAERSANKTL